jgi:3-hydroxymyristoyl/3-hydroxydecanoyl-(acyl carrier protein) dehydratase
MELRAELQAPLDHPCYDGHFPGRAILPGVVLVELVVERVGRGPPRTIPNLKFHRSLAPGEMFTLQWKAEVDRVSFRCDIAQERVAEGVLEFGGAP